MKPLIFLDPIGHSVTRMRMGFAVKYYCTKRFWPKGGWYGPDLVPIETELKWIVGP